MLWQCLSFEQITIMIRKLLLCERQNETAQDKRVKRYRSRDVLVTYHIYRLCTKIRAFLSKVSSASA